MSDSTGDITIELNQKNVKLKPRCAEPIPCSDSKAPSQNSNGANVVSRTYLRDATEHLLIWMDRMKQEEITPQNVNAVCNLAQQVATLVKVNIEIKKIGL